jgi:nickel-dependent lactate racemase
MAYKLLQQKGDMIFDLPSGWEVKQTIFRQTDRVDVSPKELMIEALAGPIGSAPLQGLLRPEATVAIVVDDITRATPVKDLLPGVLEVIKTGGIPPARVDIVIGNGTHRPLSAREMETRVGREVFRDYRVQNHDARSPDLVVMGEVEGYGPVSFNPIVAKAEVKIILGSISPHVHNGFGGGPKNIMPGICDFNTIRRHHLKNCLDPRSLVGITEDNPFLHDTIQIAKLARVDFAIQCLYDAYGRICNVLAGDVFAVHETAIKQETEQLGIQVHGKTDVTIVSSFPYDEGVQIMKSFLPSAMVTRPGGSIFVVTELTEPLPDFFLESVKTVRSGDCDEAQTRLLEKLDRHEPLVEGAGMDFTLALVLIFCVSRQFNLTMIGHNVLEEAAAAMGYEYSPDLTAALQREHKARQEASVSVIPGGGYIFPIVSDPFYLFGDR